MPKGVFRMKKLLLVLLVPVLVLGLMVGCGYETGVEVDAYLQGSWTALTVAGASATDIFVLALGDHDVFVTPNEMTVRYEGLNDIESVPFNIQFKYGYPTKDGRAFPFERSNVNSKVNLSVSFLNATIESKGDFFDKLKIINTPAGRKALADVSDVSDSTYTGLDLVSDMTDAMIEAAFNAYFAAPLNIITFAQLTDKQKDDWKATYANIYKSVWVERLITEMAAKANLNLGIESFVVMGELLVSDYRSGAELAKLSTVVLSTTKNNVAEEQGLAFFGLKYSENVPLYMLQIPLSVGVYSQN